MMKTVLCYSMCKWWVLAKLVTYLKFNEVITICSLSLAQFHEYCMCATIISVSLAAERCYLRFMRFCASFTITTACL